MIILQIIIWAILCMAFLPIILSVIGTIMFIAIEVVVLIIEKFSGSE